MSVHDLTWFDVLRRNAQLRPDATALVFEGERLSHRDLLGRAECLASGLAARGIGHGDRVAVVAQNRPEMLDLLAAAARLGAILLPLNWRLGADEVADILADVEPALLVADRDGAALLSGVRDRMAGVAHRVALDDAAEGWSAFADLLSGPGPAPDAQVRAGDPLVIIPTAAVEGRARGAVLSHANLFAHNLQLAASWALGPADVALAALPLFHIAGLGLALALQAAGGSSVLLRRFEPAAAADAIAAERVTVFCEFAPILSQILDAAAERGSDLGSLKAVWGLDGADTIARFEAACPGAAFWAGYGQSETSGYVTFAPHRERPGSAGRPTPLARVAVLDEGDDPVPPGAVGEIAVRGPVVFAGYWRREADTETTFRAGWHHTGDLGRFDPDGYLFYAGRSPAKDLIKTGGENVYPAEVERALRDHPAVAAAAVIGVPDPTWGEAVKAICVRRPGHDLSERDLIDFVGGRIARYKRPRSVVWVDALPLTPAGAVDRARVKAEHGGP